MLVSTRPRTALAATAAVAALAATATARSSRRSCVAGTTFFGHDALVHLRLADGSEVDVRTLGPQRAAEGDDVGVVVRERSPPSPPEHGGSTSVPAATGPVVVPSCTRWGQRRGIGRSCASREARAPPMGRACADRTSPPRAMPHARARVRPGSGSCWPWCW